MTMPFYEFVVFIIFFEPYWKTMSQIRHRMIIGSNICFDFEREILDCQHCEQTLLNIVGKNDKD